MKIVFYRPHENIWFRNPVKNIRNKSLLPNKYGTLFDYALNSRHQVYLAPALCYGSGLKGFRQSIKDSIELFVWCYLNKINLSKVSFIFTKKALTSKDALFAMYYGNFTHESKEMATQGRMLAECLADVAIYKVVHMTHYAYNPLIGEANLKILSPDSLVAENNLGKNSDFFNKNFNDFSTKFELLPYTPMARFINRTPFKDRTNKLVVTGSITYKMKDKEFIDYYGVDELQPLRRVLYTHASEYKNEMECLIFDLNVQKSIKPKIAKDSLQKRLIRRIYRLFRSIPSSSPQHKYYQKDIVETYNEHMMFAVPEEICDLPAIGFVEGMACGCAYFGIDNPMYRDVGLIPDVHYVTYDGSIEDLMAKVRYYQKNTKELEDIAKLGYEFVINNLSPEMVYRTFFERLNSVITDKKK